MVGPDRAEYGKLRAASTIRHAGKVRRPPLASSLTGEHPFSGQSALRNSACQMQKDSNKEYATKVIQGD
jgi:hypothetical protein